MARSERTILYRSTGASIRDLRRMPAVSINTKSCPSWLQWVSIESRVVPATSLTITRS